MSRIHPASWYRSGGAGETSRHPAQSLGERRAPDAVVVPAGANAQDEVEAAVGPRVSSFEVSDAR
ncbi:MAG TPA: hypothetical protein VHX15_02100 [Frankiaceae bacterium]|nr:hypothetical protein [Frankiaceae bacterium]